MNRYRRFYDMRTLLLLLCVLFGVLQPLRAEEGTSPIAEIVSIQGKVEVRRAQGTVWAMAKPGDVFFFGDIVRVLENSRAAVRLRNDSILRIDANTTIVFAGIEKQRTFLLDLIEGAVHFFSRSPKSLKILTPFMAGTVEGTEFSVTVDADATDITVYDGSVRTTNSAGEALLRPGESMRVQSGQPPQPTVRARPRDAVQWTLYYPLLIDFRGAQPGQAQMLWQRQAAGSLAAARKGRFSRALELLTRDVTASQEPGFYVYRGGLYLAVGRVQKASADIDRILSLQPENAAALALRSAIATAQSRPSEAIDLARRALRSDPASVPALLALSYAQQAGFQLEDALESIDAAIALDSDNALAWTRRSELKLSTGELADARRAAARAVALNPDLARTRTVAGFAALVQMDIRGALAEFDLAIAGDQADPMPRLGLGLAQIRSGDLNTGRIQIEIAVALDPNNALLRSYLGKAYAEEDRPAEAGKQLAMAKGLDPLDPTPWLYDALLKQNSNRPVEALHDLTRSIQLNDNRAVYRSRLLLDEDLATRSAGLARIYSELGFGQLALSEGWTSLTADPGNHSAHRFLADAYVTLPRHEIARVSELLQSQLRQPINIQPLQPQLAETSLAIFEGAAPARATFNEFTPLFNRNRVALQLDGVVGANATYGDDLIFSGVADRFSWSTGQFHYQTDGFRPNNHLRHNAINAFGQYLLSPQTSFMAELRAAEVDAGYLELRFDRDAAVLDFSETGYSKSFRVGARQAFSARSDLIVTGISQSFERTDNGFASPEVIWDRTIDLESRMLEAQCYTRQPWFRAIAGAGHFDGERHVTVEYLDVVVIEEEKGIRYTNGYLYTLLTLPAQVTWTLGASVDFYEGYADKKTRTHPKMGVIWEVTPQIRFRAAAFTALKRDLVSNQTLEPTQVAGFNQFFDYWNGTDIASAGLAVDAKLTSRIFGGLEFVQRDLVVTFRQNDLTPDDSDWTEKVWRAYLYSTPTKRTTVGLEYQFEHFTKDGKWITPGFFTDLQTHRIPLSAHYFHPFGISSTIKATYVDQKGEFIDPFTLARQDGDDRFWILDAAVRYRIPGLRGIISVEGKNLLDVRHNFLDTDPSHPTISPERAFYVRASFQF